MNLVVVGPYRMIQRLEDRDVHWLHLLSHGAIPKNLPGLASEGAIKNRLGMIRSFMNVRTTTEAVAEAMRRGIIR